ncbi:alkaline phosphatase family protein [Chitinophaga filiformis]|uniref:Predicted pyrophosphatase or phosphodiesterase, AlkP superfamily n=1 Tax=Chitinophaga filiformis TaxID=104663 RepID=A0A1G7LF93_CHIFI|nr:ectonucleotide pyrophosphatase/phosphodiesterase [Chitinophaga filiformis]SDF48158.1 Predicted pyrophosphatase or phosphodiesterase, AlkP superfamily [Chitinophaga filiformis]
MKRIYAMAGGLLLTLSAAAQQTGHVVLITIDGFRPDFYKEASWGMNNLRMMKENGVSADGVNCVFPSVTYPDHTTIITGVKPAKHGIYYNAPFEEGKASGVWYFYYSGIKVPTLYDAVHKAGKTNANVIWPVTVGGPIDYNVPDIWPIGKSTDRREATAEATTPAGLWQELQDNATGKLGADDFSMVREELVMDENVARMGAYIITKYKPAFTTLHLACTDHYEHMQGRDGLLVRKSVAGADRAIGTILEALIRAGIKDSTTVIVTGDHGFVDIQQSFSPNVLLADAGLITDIDSGNWKARFHSAGGSAFLHLKDKHDKASLEKVKEILAHLPADQQQLFKIIDRKQLDAIGADPNAALALAAAPGVTIGAGVKGTVVKAAKGGTHGFYPDFREIQTGFVAYGAGIAKGNTVKEMDLTDVAPIIAKLLGLSFNTADGHIPAGVLK